MTGTDRRVLLLLLVGATAAWMNLASLHESEHADSLLLVLVSTQRWTPFYWGQDRFGMLLPLLAMPVHRPVLNMVVQGFLSTVAVLLAPFLVARFLSRDHWFAIGALTNVALLLVASREVQFDWFCNQPYGLAMTLGFGGLVVLEDVQRPAARIVAALLIVLAHWVHVGVFVVLVPAILLRRPSMIRGLVLVVVGEIAGVLLARLAAAPHTPAALTPIAVWPHGWVELLQTSRAIVAHPVSLIVLGVVAVCVTLLLLYRTDRDPVVLSCIAVGVALTHWLVVGASEWVRMNLYYPRYIFPSLMMLGIAAVTPIVFLAGRVPLGDRRPRFLIGASAIALLVTSMSVYGMPSWRRLTAGLDERFGRMTADVMASHVTVIAGDYWTVWPTVFHANAALYHETGRSSVFGLTYRSDDTIDLWRGKGERVLVGAKAGERSIGSYAERAGLDLIFLEHRPTLEIFAATER